MYLLIRIGHWYSNLINSLPDDNMKSQFIELLSDFFFKTLQLGKVFTRGKTSKNAKFEEKKDVKWCDKGKQLLINAFRFPSLQILFNIWSVIVISVCINKELREKFQCACVQ